MPITGGQININMLPMFNWFSIAIHWLHVYANCEQLAEVMEFKLANSELRCFHFTTHLARATNSTSFHLRHVSPTNWSTEAFILASRSFWASNKFLLFTTTPSSLPSLRGRIRPIIRCGVWFGASLSFNSLGFSVLQYSMMVTSVAFGLFLFCFICFIFCLVLFWTRQPNDDSTCCSSGVKSLKTQTHTQK